MLKLTNKDARDASSTDAYVEHHSSDTLGFGEFRNKSETNRARNLLKRSLFKNNTNQTESSDAKLFDR